MKNVIRLTGILSIIAAIISGCGYGGTPVYAIKGAQPWETLRGTEDAQYRTGDIVVVCGSWREGGTPGGSVRVLSVGEPESLDDGILLASYPISERVFYLNKPVENPYDFLEVTGFLAGDDLYAYGYVIDNEVDKPVPIAELDESVIRADIEAMAPRIREVNLDDITGDFHRKLNEGYEIKADPAAAEFGVAGRDFIRGMTVYRAFLEQLPPYEDPQWYRSLDLYMIYDDDDTILYGVVCVGGYFLE
jgi:hypothetical protein